MVAVILGHTWCASVLLFNGQQFCEGVKKIKKEEWFNIIPELASPYAHAVNAELDLPGMIVKRLALIREHTVELYKMLTSLPLERLQTCMGPFVLEYNHEHPRSLKMAFPLPLPTIKVLSYCLDARSRGAVMQYSAIKTFWHSLVGDVMDWGYKNRVLKNFCAFEKAIVEVKFHEVDLRTRDADNYCLVVLHNALVRNSIITDDSFDRMKYCVSGIGGCKLEQTVVVVRDDVWGNSMIKC